MGCCFYPWAPKKADLETENAEGQYRRTLSIEHLVVSKEDPQEANQSWAHL